MVSRPQRLRSKASGLALGLTAGALLLNSCGMGQKPQESKPLSADDSSIATVEKTVAKRAAPSVQRVSYPVRGTGDPWQNWGDLYLPSGIHKAKSVPMVVLIHGGGWRSTSGAGDFSYYASALADRGLAVYNIEYRRVGSGGGWPTTFTDVASALDHVPDLVKEHPELKPDAQVVGHSAGAQLALWAGTRADRPSDAIAPNPRFKPSRIVALAGPLDMSFASKTGDQGMVDAIGGSPSSLARRYAAVDPIQNIDPNIPVVAVHGTADQTVSYLNSQRYIDAVHRAGGTGTLRLLDGDNHGTLICPRNPQLPGSAGPHLERFRA